MDKSILMLVIIHVVCKRIGFSTMIQTKFSPESAAEQQNITTYKRVSSTYDFEQGQPNLVQCAFPCTDHNNCKSVHINNEACVFGVDDVTAFEEGELVTPEPGQVLRVKGKKAFRNVM